MESESSTVGAHQSKRLLLACDKCRALKVKCVREEGQPCLKCAKSQSKCVVPEPKKRTRQTQRATPRLVELESKLTHLLGLLSPSVDENFHIARPESAALAAQVVTDQDLNQPSAEWLGYNSLTDPYPAPDLVGVPGLTAESSSGTWTTTTNIDNAWISDLGLSPVVLQHLLDLFRSMDSYFPFVLISAGWTAASMAEERPFLLLAAVTSASSGYYHLQQALVEKSKEILSHRVVMAGEKDLDLLQGLLVHLAWFHFYLDPRSPQTYQYLQMAISMVVDLGLDQSTADQRTELGGPDSREACRADLGCFYLSSIITMSTGKPNNLPFSEHVLPCAIMLQREREFQSDELIYPVLRLQQFANEIYETYRLGERQIHGSRFHSHVERSMIRLDELWYALSAEVRCAALLTNAYHAVKILIYEMGLVYRYGQISRPSPGVPGYSAIFAPSKVVFNLTKSIIASKEYLDLFIATPSDEYSKLPLATWYQVILAVMVLYRLSIGLADIPDWSRDIAHDTVNLEEYLDILRCRLQSTGTETEREIQSPQPGCLFAMFPEIMESVKTSYVSAKRRRICDGSGAHQSLFGNDIKRISSSARGPYRCPGMRNLRPQAVANSEDNSTLRSLVAVEIKKIEKIENEKLWNDLMTTDAFYNTTTESSAEARPPSSNQSHSGKACVDTLFPAESNRCGSTVNNPSISRGS
ncbi:hypothetical protein BJX76DRAFT_368549 [Aspergillus varians]